MTLDNGEVLDLYVPAELHQGSIHGQLGYACVQCHTDVGEYPHPPFSASDLRDVTLQLNEVCARCHIQQYEDNQDGVHAAAQQNGVREAAVCVDCHTAHEVRRLTDPDTNELLPEARLWIPERCGLCHSEIYAKYKESVHGSALSEGNPDVPTCIDCHGVHNIENPTTSYFRLRSPQMCAECHTDEQIMSKYGLSTNVLNSYVSDFHGTTTAIFERQSPDHEVNTPVCYDCHGVHDIGRTDDPNTGLEMQDNILRRCQVCHPDATSNFPTAWMSHYIPSPEKYPLVYYVNLFYKFFIPITLGGMALLVVMDASRALINRRRRREEGLEEEVVFEEETPLLVSETINAEATSDNDLSLPEMQTVFQQETEAEQAISADSLEEILPPEDGEKIPQEPFTDEDITHAQDPSSDQDTDTDKEDGRYGKTTDEN
jgi:nitrate/TMAO reductase-like tetraheme cytochrome c subunit